MKYLRGPRVELNFYYADIGEQAALGRLMRALIELGAEFVGEGLVHVGANAQKPFGSPYDLPCETMNFTLSDLDILLADPEKRLVEVYFYNAVGLAQKDVAEEVMFVSISEEAARSDKHPVALHTDGDAFSYPPEYTDIARAQEGGKQVYERFTMLVKKTRPAYAAITYEYYMKCPMDLRVDSYHYEFNDFFVSEVYLGSARIDAVQRLYHGAYVERLGDGIYLSCYEYFNPRGVELRDDDLARGAAMAQIIASVTSSTD